MPTDERDHDHTWDRRARLRACTLVTLCIALVICLGSLAAEVEYPDVVPGYQISFPEDEGSHPEFRTEWWYVTGWVEDEAGVERGFQVTFFRARPGLDEDNPSRFAAKQLLFAHAAISDAKKGALLRAERSARAGFGLAEAEQGRLAVHIDDWSLRREGDVYRTSVRAADFVIELELRATQPPLLQGENGFSQKGPDPLSASYYYSLPHLATTGVLSIEGRRHRVKGRAWFDHEWSSQLLDEAAVGWDWIGLNLDDGSAVMAAQIRTRDGGAHWAIGTWRDGVSRDVSTFRPAEIEWTAGRRWRSSRSGIEYPVEWRVRLGERALALAPLMDDQENDTRASTGTIYWEGAVRVFDERGSYVGKGYLEMTGYGRRSSALSSGREAWSSGEAR
ncbi:MAG: carotenoid 1,2-hydratase [Gammaproteobacteria bacterium]|nr:carotenoid 1,2-hydratase [Gammaproteobacteria bacterium]